MTSESIEGDGLVDEVGRLAAGGYWASVIELIEKKPQVLKAVDWRGRGILHWLCRYPRSTPALRRALELGADVDVDALTPAGTSPLIFAVESGQRHGLSAIPNVEVLLDAGCDIELQGYLEKTALQCAIHARDYEVCRLLLRRGAKTSTRNEYDEDAVEYAKSIEAWGFLDIVEEERGARSE